MVFELYHYLKSVLENHQDVYLDEQPGLDRLTVRIKTIPGIDCKKEKKLPKFVTVTTVIHSGCGLYSYKDEVDNLINRLKETYPKTHSLEDLREYIILKSIVDDLEKSKLHYNEYNPWSEEYKKHI